MELPSAPLWIEAGCSDEAIGRCRSLAVSWDVRSNFVIHLKTCERSSRLLDAVTQCNYLGNTVTVAVLPPEHYWLALKLNPR